MSEDHWITDWEISPRFPVYTRANAGEVLPDPSSPLNVTFVWDEGLVPGWRDGYVEELGTHHASELSEVRAEVIGNFAGYHYVNLSATEIIGARLPGMTVPVWNSLWVGDHPDVPDYVEKPGDVSPELTERLSAKMAWALETTEFPEVAEGKRRADAARRERPDLTSLTDAELVARARELQPLIRYTHRYHPPSTTLSTVGPAVAGGLLAAIGQESAMGVLLSGLGDVDSAGPSFALWRLSRLANASAVVTRALDGGLTTALDEIRASDEAGAVAFTQAFDDFLLEFGSRAPNEWDLRSESWETKPVLALALLDGMRSSSDDNDPALTFERNRAAREKLTPELAAQMPDEESRASFLAAAASITRFMPWRERTKTNCVKVLGEMRAAFFELGRRMVEREVLADRRDITMLKSDELDAFLADPESWKDEIARRSERYLELFDLEPPFILTSNPPLADWPRRKEHKVTPAVPGDVLTGIGGSQGKARGRARIVTDPFESGEFAPGDILVAPQTDPAWTPLFVTAAAVVVNVGATITHAMIVCRELGIPCAASVADATLRIADGALIEVDGDAGTVTLL